MGTDQEYAKEGKGPFGCWMELGGVVAGVMLVAFAFYVIVSDLVIG